MTKGVATTVTYKAVNASTGAPANNDQANHALKIFNGGTATTPNHAPAFVAIGEYSLAVDASEITADAWTLDGTSSTSGVVIVPVRFATTTPSLRYVNDSTHNDPR